jgi:hypothetical protein
MMPLVWCGPEHYRLAVIAPHLRLSCFLFCDENPSMLLAISSPCVSRAKHPVSTRCVSRFLKSRLRGPAPFRRKDEVDLAPYNQNGWLVLPEESLKYRVTVEHSEAARFLDCLFCGVHTNRDAVVLAKAARKHYLVLSSCLRQSPCLPASVKIPHTQSISGVERFVAVGDCWGRRRRLWPTGSVITIELRGRGTSRQICSAPRGGLWRHRCRCPR